MAPREFFDLTPQEWWWLHEQKAPQQMFGSLTREEVAELYEEAYGDG